MSRIQIAQQPNLEQITFLPKDSYAFSGSELARGEYISLQAVELNPTHPGEVMVTFVPAIKPGKTVTLALRARNPHYGGIYQFGVTVFPENSQQGLYLGNGRLHFSQPGGLGG